jgi:hypothetical protein
MIDCFLSDNGIVPLNLHISKNAHSTGTFSPFRPVSEDYVAKGRQRANQRFFARFFLGLAPFRGTGFFSTLAGVVGTTGAIGRAFFASLRAVSFRQRHHARAAPNAHAPATAKWAIALPRLPCSITTKALRARVTHATESKRPAIMWIMRSPSSLSRGAP